TPRLGLSGTCGVSGDYLDSGRFPVLGICAGHQFMARHFGGSVALAKVPEFGAIDLTIIERGTILAGIPHDAITVWESHNDEVVEIPEGFDLLASSESCRVQAIENAERGLFGLQFHPEVTHTQFGRDIFANFVGFCAER
ncbi:MAG: gamma-glutamyl-gamma-aminobutyrate hydrolase family protein, partial [Thermoplasmata archaeon]|nr:gamma-glutamyl-gamma-aminobutyrate hydrolase family protein [Thermoplasmata archaeon]